MRLFIFEEKAEIHSSINTYPLSLKRDRDRLQKYWANKVHNVHEKDIHYQNSITKPHSQS